MNGSAIRSVLRHALVRSRDAAALADAELVRRIAATGDDAAFAAIVGRHGPMVWGVCRHLLADDADADDAFQATFLTFLRSAAALRDHGSLAGWLHRVASRVALKARRSAARRRRREQAAAVGEAASAVADAAWDQLLGAVHEEVNRLPDALRVPFVLCCLEGRRVTDAAETLGRKLGTVSARLTRAKQRILDRLARRGLPAAAVAGAVGLAAATSSAAVPLAVLDQTIALTGAAGTIAPAVVQLSLGGMKMKITRSILAGTVLVAAGLFATGIRPALLPWATAQSDPRAATPVPVDPSTGQPSRKVSGKWEYTYVRVSPPVSATAFESACRNMEPAGWEYSGTQEMALDRVPDGTGALKSGPQLVLVFKRPRGAVRTAVDASSGSRYTDLTDAKARIEALERELTVLREAERAARARALYAQDLGHLSINGKWAADDAAKELLAKKDAQAKARADAEDLAKLDATKRDWELRLKNNPAAALRDDRMKVKDAANPADASQGAAKRVAITIIPLGDGSAEKMAKMLTDLFGQQGTFQADERSNSLIVKADAQTLTEVENLLDRLQRQAAVKIEREAEMKAREKADLEKRYLPPKQK